MQEIRGLPINDTPEMFGLHENANITFALNETFALLNGILLLQPKSSAGGGQSREEVCIADLHMLHENSVGYLLLPQRCLE